MHFFSYILAFSVGIGCSIAVTPPHGLKACVVKPSGNETIDDAPAIIDAFVRCGHDGKVIFRNETYHINSVMNTTGLKNCEVDLQGTLLWGTNITYWLNHSLPVGYQNQSSAWIFGGDNITFQGHGTMTIIHSEDVFLQDIYVNNLSNTGSSSSNTDGANTIFSNNITFNRWNITNGDDGISLKANSTNIRLNEITLNDGLGIAFCSIGQYNGVFETIENVTATNITCHKTLHGAYVKTWTGQQVGYPPNGGGAGLGYMRNIVLSNFAVNNIRGTPFSISQCTTFSGASGACNSSLFEIKDLTFTDVTGTMASNPISSLQCSAAAPCENIAIQNIDLTLSNGTIASGYNCDAVLDPVGFNCTGSTCGTNSATGSC